MVREPLCVGFHKHNLGKRRNPPCHLREGGDRAIERLPFREIHARVQFVLVIERDPIPAHQIV